MVWDKVLSWNAWFRDDVTLPRLRAAGYGVVGLTVGGGSGGRAATERSIAAVQALVDREPDQYRLVRGIDDVEAAQRSGQLALELNLQGADPLEGRLEAVAELHALGIRQIGLVWNADNALGCSAMSATDHGLTDLGRSFVREMNRVGVLVDGSHAGRRTTLEAMEASEHPVVFSHANVAALRASPKNLDDDQIRLCAGRGGVIGVSGFGTYLDDRAAPVEAMFRQVDYLCERIGHRHVGLGLDFVRDPAPLWEKVRAHPELWPDVVESRFFPPEEVSGLEARMLRAGYTEAQVAAILGDNWKRVSAQVWSGAAAPVAHG